MTKLLIIANRGNAGPDECGGCDYCLETDEGEEFCGVFGIVGHDFERVPACIVAENAMDRALADAKEELEDLLLRYQEAHEARRCKRALKQAWMAWTLRFSGSEIWLPGALQANDMLTEIEEQVP